MVRRLFVWVVFLTVAGCVWRGYATIMNVHLDVLTQTAAKLCAVVQADKGPSTEGIAEYVCPAKRGREFLRQFSGDSARRSYTQFGAFLDRYEALVRDVDASRARGSDWRTALPEFPAECDALPQQAHEIRERLREEG